MIERIYKKIAREIGNVQRRRIAERVTALRPSPPPGGNAPFSVHALVCKRDVNMAICSGKSLNLAAGKALPWFFHDDGSLGDREVQLLRHHFPGCTVLTRPYADAALQPVLAPFPRVQEARRQYVMMLKLVDLVFFAPRERILYVDTDILFFDKPSQLLEGGAQNLFNRDIGNSYLYPPAELLAFTGIRVLERVNAGLSSLRKECFGIGEMERVLGQIPLRENLIYHRIEQTLVALLATASPGGAAHLAPAYDVSYDKPVAPSVCKHYVGAIRPQFEREGLVYLLDALQFEGRWNQFVEHS
ncbi:MAG: hypothetical protein ICV83_01310 [Cytophagales bacterium]|nr:hypothetical protein [Cytophagales bacterium]